MIYGRRNGDDAPMPRRREERRGFLDCLYLTRGPGGLRDCRRVVGKVRLRGPGTCTRSVGRESTPENRRVRGKGP